MHMKSKIFVFLMWCRLYTSFGQGQNFVQKDWVNGIFSLGPDEEGIGSTISLCIFFCHLFQCHLLNLHSKRWSDQCNYKATEKGSLRQHIKSIHEGKQYPCVKCDYKATERGSLRQHIKSIHEGERYPCKKCDYKATQKGSLRQHIKSIHEGERYPCS